ncbi:MAG: cyanophycinase [Opitutaceae bacterium]|nr:cyanophycinase [Opitutaceae bacterium]
MSRLAALLLAVLSPLAAADRATSYDYWITGNPADAHPATTRAGLVLAGGGSEVVEAWKWFVACAGGGDIVVLRASGGDGYHGLVTDKVGGADSIETILFHDASAAHDPRVLDIIARAEGIWLAGGDQARYVAYWKDTPVGAALNAHLRAGKPLGGTSAGLAVLGEYYFAALHGSVTSETVLRDPFHRAVTLGRGFIAAPALAGVLTDSHFMARQRLGRLIAFLARLQADEKPARLVGLGLDEATALCVEPDGHATVFTEKNGRAWLVVTTQPPEPPVAGKPLAARGIRVTGLGPESTLNLTDLRVARPIALRTFSVIDGTLLEDPATP